MFISMRVINTIGAVMFHMKVNKFVRPFQVMTILLKIT